MKRRISLMVGRCVLSAAADDKTLFQTLQVDALAGETLSELERFQNYGFTSVPFEGSEACVVFPQGNRDHGLVIAVDDRRYRLVGLKEGEVAMYTDEGDKIHIKRGGNLEITVSDTVEINCKNSTVNASTKAVVDAPAIELGAGGVDAVLKGTAFQAFFNAHTHTGNAGVLTSPPTSPSIPAHLSTISKVK
jgi:phage baseplate assembly protein V